jgi:hypothetical protein
MNNNYTTKEQSDRLINAGIPVSSADCYYLDLGLNEYSDRPYWGVSTDGIPCWSVGRLQEIAKICAKEKEYYYASLDTVAHQEDFVEWWVKHFTLTDNVLFDFSKLV